MITVMSSGAAAARERRNAVEELLARDTWSREQLMSHQRRRMRQLIEYAVSASPYYRDALGRDALDPDLRLEDLPALSKATLMEQFDRVVTAPAVRLAGLEAHAAGTDPGALVAADHHLFMTSGTTGRRGVFPQTRPEFEGWVSAAWRVLARIGVTPGARAIGIAAPTPLHITQKLFAALGGFGAGRPELTVITPLPQIVATLNAEQPELLLGVCSMIGMLAREQLAGRLAIHPRRVLVSSEVLTDEVIRQVAAAWGTEPFEVYASTEALFIAAEGPERVGLHVGEDLVVLEVVDERGRPVPQGVPGYKVLLTNLVNRTLPLIRYELADAVTIARGPDPSGRPYLRIERVDGRNDEILILPAVGGGEARVLPQRLRTPFSQLPHVIQYQLVHETDRLLVRIVLGSQASRDMPERVRARVQAALEDCGAIAPPIVVEPVSTIECEPGSAKVRLIKSTATRA